MRTGIVNKRANNRFERDFCYAAAPQKPLKRSVRHREKCRELSDRIEM